MEFTLRDIQLCELQILKDIREVCDRHHLRYYLCGGTLLGAVRHKGFIPWDDDVDIHMPYDDYLRFLEVAQKELGDGYFVQTSDTDPRYALAYTHIRKNNTALLTAEDRNNPTHHGVWVDVFPMLYVRGKADYKIKRAAVKACYYLRVDDETFNANKDRFRQRSSGFTVGAISLVRKLPQKLRFKIRNNILESLFRSKKGKYICFVWVNLSKMFPAEYYSGEPLNLPFEDDEFPAPREYDKHLTLQYGDYMTPPPPEKRNGGHGEYEIVDLEHDWSYYFGK